MSKKIIKVSLSESSIDNAIKLLKQYKIDVETKKLEILKRLAELGQLTAFTTYGSSGIQVTTESTDNGYRFLIRADGEYICFLEFGAGTMTDFAHPFASEVPFEVYPGSWSVNHAQQFSTKGYWYFGGKKYMYIAPRRGMLEASKAIQNNVLKIAREVFR